MVRGHLPRRWRNLILPDGAMDLIINLGDPQTLCALEALTDGSWLVNETSVSFEICTRLGIEAPIEMEPVDVAPSVP